MTQDDKIFLFTGSGGLTTVSRHHYENEAILQALIEQYPDLLAGDQMGADEPVRFLLVKREAGIPDADGACNRWSVDHLLLDQQGVPTLVEVKRSSDTRIRREVVGQLLEYAANVEVYWPSDRIRGLAVEQHGGSEALDQAIIELLGADTGIQDATDTIESFWSLVDENMRNGRLRLLFVADELPREVRRIIEFLNGKLNDVEVLGVELRQYVKGDLRAMVPRIIGQTEVTRTKGAKSAPQRPTTKAEMIAACPVEVRDYVEDLISQAQERGLVVFWGTKGFSMRVRMPNGKLQTLLYCYPPGANESPTAQVLGYLDTNVRGTEAAEELAAGLLNIAGVKRSWSYTFTLPLTEETLDQAHQVLSVVWKVAESIREETASVDGPDAE